MTPVARARGVDILGDDNEEEDDKAFGKQLSLGPARYRQDSLLQADEEMKRAKSCNRLPQAQKLAQPATFNLSDPRLQASFVSLTYDDLMQRKKYQTEILKFLHDLPQMPESALQQLAVNSHKYPKRSPMRKTIVFDMDETLLKSARR